MNGRGGGRVFLTTDRAAADDDGGACVLVRYALGGAAPFEEAFEALVAEAAAIAPTYLARIPHCKCGF